MMDEGNTKVWKLSRYKMVTRLIIPYLNRYHLLQTEISESDRDMTKSCSFQQIFDINTWNGLSITSQHKRSKTDVKCYKCWTIKPYSLQYYIIIVYPIYYYVVYYNIYSRVLIEPYKPVAKGNSKNRLKDNGNERTARQAIISDIIIVFQGDFNIW